MKNLRHLLSRSGLLSNEKRRRRPVTSRRSDSTSRRLSTETLEKRELLAGDALQNIHSSWDVNDDQQITPSDALAIINRLGRGGESESGGDSQKKMYYDVNGDNNVTAADALSVINAIGRGEEVGELIELFLTARDLNDNPLPVDGNGAVNVEVGQVFDLEVSYDDLRFFNEQQGAFQLLTDIGISQGGVLTPVFGETQSLIIDSSLRPDQPDFVESTAVVFTIPELPPGVTNGQTSFSSPFNDFANGSRAEVVKALAAFGYTSDQYQLNIPDVGTDLGFEITFTDPDLGNVNVPNITVDVIEVDSNTTVPTSSTEIAPFLADGVTPNPDAVPFNLKTRSRTFDNNQPFYTLFNRGSFDPVEGFVGVGGVGQGVRGGGIPAETSDGSFPQPFDAYSLRVFVNQPVMGLQVDVNPGEDVEATLLYGRDDRTPQDLVLVNPDNAVVTINATAVNNQAGTLSIADVQVDEDAGTAMLTVTRTGGSTGAVTVDFATSNGTATAGLDYTANSGTLTFAEGVTSQTISVTIADDSEVEDDEVFTVTLSNATGGATLGNVSATTTIVDDDEVVANPGTLSISPATLNVNEGAGTATFTVTRSAGSAGSVTVAFATANGTATAGSDYTANSGTLTFADGVTSQTITVQVTEDVVDEDNETFTVTISNPTGGATLGTVTASTATIIDNDNVDPMPGTLTISPATLNVNEDGGNATFTVTRSGGSDGSVTVNFATANGTATAGSDYTAQTGTLTFADGVLTQTISVPITNDTADEPNETFTVTISSPSGGATLGTTTVSTATIVDNDAAPVPGVLSLSQATVSVNENAGTATFTVNRTGGSDGSVTVNFATANGTATAGSDYTARTGTLTFADGVTSQTISVPVTNDTTDEPNETFTVTLSGPTGGATLGAVATATATIVDDDDPTVTNNPPTSGPVNVTATEDVTATFTSTQLLVNASPGTGESSTQTVSITSVSGASAQGGTVTRNANGSVNYRAANNFNGSDSFTVTITDTGTPAMSVTYTVNVNVAAVNDPPVAVNDTATVFSGGTATITVLNNDNAGPANEPQALTLVSATSTGGTAVANANGTISFTPNAGVTSTTINYTIRDSEGLTATAVVNVTVQDFVPTTISGSVFIDSIESLANPVRNGVHDDNEQGLGGILVRLTNAAGETVASVRTASDGSYSITDVAPGDYSINYDLPDTLLPIGTTSTPINVTSSSAATIESNMALFGTQGSAVETVDILAATYLRNNQSIATISDGGREGGLVSLDSNGSQEFFIAGAGFEDADSVEFVLSDSGDSALLVVVEENATSPSVARLGRDNFVVTNDGRGVQFFGGLDDFDFVTGGNDLDSSDFSNFQSAIDRAMADL